MQKWEQFEIDCTNYLQENYKDMIFEHNGGSNSTTSDIKVNNEYYIEVKHTPAQCCQFVLFPENNYFYYSQDNKNPLNQYSAKIIDYMNQKYEYYSDKNKKAKPIIYDNCQADFFGCIKEFYAHKNVKYFITNDFLIVPIDNIQDVFEVSAVYRVKKSGSKNPNKSIILELSKYIAEKCLITAVEYDGKHLIVDTNVDINKQILTYNGNNFMFSIKNGRYIVRQLSNTSNSNVIFSLKLLKNKNIPKNLWKIFK